MDPMEVVRNSPHEGRIGDILSLHSDHVTSSAPATNTALFLHSLTRQFEERGGRRNNKDERTINANKRNAVFAFLKEGPSVRASFHLSVTYEEEKAWLCSIM